MACKACGHTNGKYELHDERVCSACEAMYFDTLFKSVRTPDCQVQGG